MFLVQQFSDGGLFKAKLSFPPDYPFMPPTMRFISEMWHPNSGLNYRIQAAHARQVRWICSGFVADMIKPFLVVFLSKPDASVYKDGKVCISILHAPGSDPNEYENASERWLPVHTVESILVSVISMLASPNDESAANLDAAKEWRDESAVFKKKVRETVRRAQEDI
jgi:ubiquitin-protein ligase